MRNRATASVALVLAALLAAADAPAQTTGRHAVSGLVIDVHPDRGRLLVSHDAVPGLMPAMTMPFEVRNVRELAGLAPGMTISFTLVLEKTAGYAEGVRVVRSESVEPDPFTSRRLQLLRRLTGTTPAPIAIGEAVPDFTLTDQVRRQVSLSQQRGKVVVVNFVYTSCVLPQFCYRMANHFGVLQKRFERRMGTDLVLLTVSFDPVRDTPERLAEYAGQWNAKPAHWHFLTGAVGDVRKVTGSFGVDFFPDEGLVTHNTRTAVIDRTGRLRANIEGNQLTATQLGDIVAGILMR